MMRPLRYYLRVAATASSFALFGLGGVTIPWLAYPIIRFAPISPARRQLWARRLIQKVFSLFIHYMRLLDVVTWDVQGAEKLRRSGLLLLANHPTLLDVVFLVAFIPNADCIVKGALTRNPAMRGFIKLTGFITNDTGPELIESVQQSIHAGGVLIIFPEGTRTTPGESLHFRRGAANLALRTHTDITPVTISCTPWGLSKQHKWYDGAVAPMHFVFRVGDDIPISDYSRLPPSKAARQLNRDLEHYFEEEVLHERSGSGIEAAHYRVTGSGGHFSR